MTSNNNRALDDKYEIVREIKKGGFGIVYFGVDKKLNKPVAIKEIAPNLLDDPKYLDMFQEEALNIAKLSHNNIVHIYELKKTSDRHLYIIMEYIDGIDLEKITRSLKKSNRLIPPHLAVYIVAEICMALDYAHQRRDAFTNKPLNLVHQDISPSNIMISRFGNVKLIDFGIATVRRHRKEKKDNKLRGKIPYMAPEQLIMGNHPDHRSDIFSLGLVLYESITGERLFTSQEEIITAGKNPKWFKKALRGKRIQPALAKILFKALEIDLTKRYQTANHMYIDLLQYLISCNETGELMDDLAQYLSEQFSSHQSPINSPGTNYTPTANTYDSSHYSYTPESNDLNHLDHNQYDLNEPISPPYAKPKTPPKPSNFSKHLMAAPQKFQSNYQTLEFDIEGEEELKTVIDVIRISARNHKKRIIQFCFGIFLALITFAVFDIINGWTKTGIWIYDLLFPPAIEIKTIPANAIIYLDEVPVKGRTPLSIDKISPGVHKLDLALEGYKTIVKSLFVPREGAIKVQGEAEVTSRTYLFRFSTEIEIKSDPANADVFINGVRFNQKTPCNLSWEVGTPLSISLEIPGFEKLTEYSLNTVEGYDEVEDRRFWDLKVFNDDYTKYSITGIFRKHVVIETIPPAAEIIDVNTNKVIGLTGNNSDVFLTAGNHKLELRKDTYKSQILELNINETFNEKVRAVLSRTVRFSALDNSGTNGTDIGASVISIKHNDNEYLRNSRNTPFELDLPAFTYTAIFAKSGYQRASQIVRPETRALVVKMEQLQSIIELTVMDALTEQPIPGVEIFYNSADRPNELSSYLDQTDLKGVSIRQLNSGNYLFTFKKFGYSDLSRPVVIRSGETFKFTFEMFPTN